MTSKTDILIKGAKTHNLKNVSVRIQQNKLTVITGVSGSGKTSLAFDTLYTEGKRRYIESLSSYVRQFLENIPKPDVDDIDNLSPTIAIEQKTVIRNTRSTVGTITEIYDLLRMLFAQIGKTYAFNTDHVVQKDTVDDVVNKIFQKPHNTIGYICFSATIDPRDFKKTIHDLRKRGFTRILIEQDLINFDDIEKLEKALKKKSHPTISFIVVDRLMIDKDDATKSRIIESAEIAFSEGRGTAFFISNEGKEITTFNNQFTHEGIQYIEPIPQLFSFNSPMGACPACKGSGQTIGIRATTVFTPPSISIKESLEGLDQSSTVEKSIKNFLASLKKVGISKHDTFKSLSDDKKNLLWHGNKTFKGLQMMFEAIEKKSPLDPLVDITLSQVRGRVTCDECQGSRLRKEANQVKISSKNISELSSMTLSGLKKFITKMLLSNYDRSVGSVVIEKLEKNLDYLENIGVGYLTLERQARTLSGGESQRINLATSLSSPLTGTIYVLDEPSVGLHQRDSRRLIKILRKLCNAGNTVIVVEHDRDIIEAADNIIDIGPGAGEKGGHVVFSGTFKKIINSSKSITGKYLSNTAQIPVPKKRRSIKKDATITIKGIEINNIKNIDVSFPLHAMTCVTGVSGSGKSSLVFDVLYKGLKDNKSLNRIRSSSFSSIEGIDSINSVDIVDQSPIGQSLRSNPATYIKAFDDIRHIFSQTEYARNKGWPISRFSFNLPGGRCEECQGEGKITIDLQFLADIDVQCEACQGLRYEKETLKATYQGKSISDVLKLTTREAINFFHGHPNLLKKLKVLDDVGLSYLRLGQTSNKLSGGESQRLKLALHLINPSIKHTLFIFDEPTTGLHFEDISKLINCFNNLLKKENTLIVVEHNLEMIKQSDWIIDLGPGAGEKGGRVVAKGPPEKIASCKESLTGIELKKILLH